MSRPVTDPLTQIAFSVVENKGVFALLLGSGLSRAAGIPTGWEITLDLIRRMAIAKGAGEEADLTKWYRDTVGAEPSYSNILESLATTPAERRAILHSYIEPTAEDREDGRKVPTAAHYAIADLVASGHIRVIVTTNFDRLIENALRERGVEPTVVSSLDGFLGAEPVVHSRCYVLKLHGDYKDTRILNTDGELEQYPSALAAGLDRILDEHGLIICGWSGEWDGGLRDALTRAANRRYSTYWTLRGSPKGLTADIISHRRAIKVAISDADNFFVDLNDRIQLLERTRTPNPRSVALLVERAKKILASNHEGELDDFISAETVTLAQQLTDEQFSTQREFSPEEFTTRIHRYETATKLLACVVGVLGRRGEARDLSLVVELVRILDSEISRPHGGTLAWLNIRTYPIVLIVSSYCLALTRAQRWNVLHQFLISPLKTEGDQPRVVDRFAGGIWYGNNKSYWNHFPDLGNRHTPVSDRLFAVMTEWSHLFLGMTSDLELEFDRSEFLMALVHFEANLISELKAAKAARPNQSFVTIPTGMFCWRRNTNKKLCEEIREQGRRLFFINSGYGGVAGEMLDLFLENLGYLSRYMGFF